MMIDMENESWARLIFAMETIANHLSVLRMIAEHQSNMDIFGDE